MVTNLVSSFIASAMNSQSYAEQSLSCTSSNTAEDSTSNSAPSSKLSASRSLEAFRLLDRDGLAPHGPCQNVAKPAAPEDWGDPIGVLFKQRFSGGGGFTRQIQLREHVRVDHDHGRSSRFAASMSRARNLLADKAARSSRARVIRSLGIILVGSNTDSRHTMASLFKLRRCICAANFSRSYTASGIFLNVRVVGMAFLIQCAAIVVSIVDLGQGAVG